MERFLLITFQANGLEKSSMKCFIVKGLIAGVLVSVTFLSCSRHGVQQTKNYQEILYGNTTAREHQPVVEQPTIIHTTSDKNATALSVDTFMLVQRTVAIFTDAALSSKITRKVAEFYSLNELKTKWLNDTEPSILYYTLIANLKSAEAYGLSSDDYNVENLEKAVASVYTDNPNMQEVIALDIRLSEICFLFTTHLSEGKVKKVGYSNYVWLREENMTKHSEDVRLLAATQTSKDLNATFDRIQPGNQNYRNLKIALTHYRDLERYAVEQLPVISLNGKIEPEARNKAIPLIRKRLSQFDLNVYPLVLDTTTGIWDSLKYDKGLVHGIIAFQIIHGLAPDGIIGAKTITFLNQNLKDRVGAITINMDRIRWTPEVNTDREYIVVNVPEYKLRIYEKENQVFDMRVIVGALENPTPIFNDYVKNVVFSPTWTVPISIIKKEIIPRLQSNPTYYTQRNYVFYKNGEEIDPSMEPWGTTQAHEYRIVQQSGGDNSLGRVKFGMTNAMRIYLHDTPAQKLFSKDFRALSHGCVRLDEPAKFAEYLLRNNTGWDTERIKKQMFEDKASTVVLKKDYPVHIQYCTAWVSADGRVNFREDIYGHDRMQLQQLSKPAVQASGIIAGL